MNSLTVIKRNDVFTDSWIIAEGTKNKHKSVKRRIGEYEKEFLSLGTLAILNRQSEGGRPDQVFQLAN